MKETYENEYVKSIHQALDLFEVLGIKDVSSKTQKKNGTTVYELPIKNMYVGANYAIRYATYESGMIRNVSPSNSSCWQINKKYGTKKKYWNSYYKKYNTYTSYERILINNNDDRVVYLANYILKNNYRKGELFNVPSYTRERIQYQQIAPVARPQTLKQKTYCSQPDQSGFKNLDEIQVIVNGQRYKLS